MKSILLTTTAIVAFAGAAVADGHAGISFAGEAELGNNDDVENGFFWSADVDTTMTAALDNGVTATATFGLGIAENNLGDTVTSSDYVLEVSTDNAALRFGDVDPVAEANFSNVDGEIVGFNDQDVHLDSVADGGVGFEGILMGEVTASGVTGMISFGVEADAANGEASEDDIDAMQVFVGATFGSVDLQVAYQDEFAGADAVYGISAGTSVAGADLDVSYMDDGTNSSLGLGASYPVGPVVLGGYYSVNDGAEDNYGVSADYSDGPIAVNAFYDFEGGATDADGDDTTEIGIEGSYDIGNGIAANAGYISTDAAGTETAAYYVAGTYDLGGGAELLVSYAEDEANAVNDEIGDPEYNHGTTVAVSFSF
jgi:hypothetical protein